MLTLLLLTLHCEHELALVLGVGLDEGHVGPGGLVEDGAVVALPVAQLRQQVGRRRGRGARLQGHLEGGKGRGRAKHRQHKYRKYIQSYIINRMKEPSCNVSSKSVFLNNTHANKGKSFHLNGAFIFFG